MAGSYARFTGKTGLVTGAGMGIGAAIARALGSEGAAVAVVDRDAAAARQVSAEITEAGGHAIAVAGSVTDAADAEGAVQAAVDAFGGLDLLVNNAGVVIYGVLPEYREQDWDTVVDTNLKGQFLMAKYALPHLRARGGGAIVNMASVQALASQREVASYAASKGRRGVADQVAGPGPRPGPDPGELRAAGLGAHPHAPPRRRTGAR